LTSIKTRRKAAAQHAPKAKHHGEFAMHPFPHHYKVSADAAPDGDVLLATPGVVPLNTAAPVEFDGPGGRWSPESLLCSAVADCFVLTFRAIARALPLPWTGLQVDVVGTLEREGRNSRFTRFELAARLELPAGADLEVAERALQRAESGCLVSNSLNAERHLRIEIATAAAVA
jgi:organic hydroperoxide reductase OsmC/OhrA